MKRLFLFLLLSAVAMPAVETSALPFDNSVIFSGTTVTALDSRGIDVTKNAIRISDTGNTTSPGNADYLPAFSYTHDVNFNPAASSINEASLSVTYTGNQANCIEAWFISNSTNDPIRLGYLDDTQDGYRDKYATNSWTTTTFSLDAYIAGVSGASWSIEFLIDENTWNDNEVMYLAESLIFGDYNPTPVPEPASILLLGTGLIGFIRSRKKY